MTLLFPIIFLIVLSFFGEVRGEELYRWVDRKGIINFTDNLHAIPEKYRRDAEKRFCKTVVIKRRQNSLKSGGNFYDD